MGRRGPKPKGAAYHLLTGYYRPSRHGPRPQDVAKAEADASDPWKTELRLGIVSRPLDPIEELLQREGIEITAEDRKPANS